MGFPQGLVDRVIDYVGGPYVKTNTPYAFFRRQIHNQESRQLDLLSWARVSKACNCRARSYLFSHCRVIGIDPLTTLKKHPRVLLERTRILEILHLSDPEALKAIICRFDSAPVVHVTLSSVPIQVGFPATFASALGNVTSVSLVGCSYNPVALKKFIGDFGSIDEIHLRNCQASHPLNGAGSVLPKLPPLERHSWTTDPRRVLRRVVLPVRTLRIESLADRTEDRLVHAWSDSLEHLEVKMSNTWGTYPLLHYLRHLANHVFSQDSFRLNLAPCFELRSLTLDASLHERSTIHLMKGMLSTVPRNHQISRIRIVLGPCHSSDPGSGAGEFTEAELKAWKSLDRLLCRVKEKARESGVVLVFQCVSREITGPLTGGYLGKLLPRFGRIGVCEEVVL